MVSTPRLTRRTLLILLADILLTVLAVVASFYLRFEAPGLEARKSLLRIILPAFAAYTGLVVSISRLHRVNWKFVSISDLISIVRVSSVLSISLLILDYILFSPYFYHGYFFGKTTIILFWLLDVLFLAAARVAYRYSAQRKSHRARTTSGASAAIVVGTLGEAEVLLRAVENGAARQFNVVGILSPDTHEIGNSIRGIDVVGGLNELERVVAGFAARGTHVSRLIMTPTSLLPDAKPETLLIQARRRGIATSRLSLLDESGLPQIAPLAMEDLLLRPTVQIDNDRLIGVVRDQAVVVTGGGGSIGAELCRRMVELGATRLLILDNSEPALYNILEELGDCGRQCRLEGHIADVRDRSRLSQLFTNFRPDLVFHAAALKHVPIVESDWSEGIKTNVFGSVNVADAAVTAGARGIVMISTDKAVEPISALGVTKRFAEMYCQALDADLRGHLSGRGMRQRLIAVRFGNVLASNGSVVPKFRAQIEAGGPITITHADMVRYFMTIREACDLVVSAATHALLDGNPQVSVYALNMGQPVKITTLAERMIRLSGLEPGVDIDVVITGVRPGERLIEPLFAPQELTVDVGIAGILGTRPVHPSLAAMRRRISEIQTALERDDRAFSFRAISDDLEAAYDDVEAIT